MAAGKTEQKTAGKEAAGKAEQTIAGKATADNAGQMTAGKEDGNLHLQHVPSTTTNILLRLILLVS